MLTEEGPIRATIEQSEIRCLIEDIYGFSCTSIKELNGYDDRNYHIHTNTNKFNNGQNSGDYVLKIINSLDSKKSDFFQAQTALLLHVGSKGICCPTPVKTKNNQYFTQKKLKNGVIHIVRLLSFIPGMILYNLPNSEANDYALFYKIGEYVANLDVVVSDFKHSAFDSHETLWMLHNAPQILNLLNAVEEQCKRNLVSTIIHHFQLKVLSQINKLSAGMIHGDFNEHNILLEETTNGHWQIKGILDFGDSHYAPYIFELAITMAYMILQLRDVDVGGYVLAGYLSVKQISEKELELLKICITARLCQSLVMGAYTNKQDPTNLYVLSTAEVGWNFLQLLWQIPDDELLIRWKNISKIISEKEIVPNKS